MQHRYDLLPLIIKALDRVIVHSHDEQAAFLSHLEDVSVVNGVCDQGLVSQAIDEELVVECHEEVLLVTPPRDQIMMIIQADISKFDCCVLLEVRLDLHYVVVWLAQISHDDPAFKVDCREQVRVWLHATEGRRDLLLVIIDDLRRVKLGTFIRDLPEFDSLVS